MENEKQAAQEALDINGFTREEITDKSKPTVDSLGDELYNRAHIPGAVSISAREDLVDYTVLPQPLHWHILQWRDTSEIFLLELARHCFGLGYN